MSERTNYDDLQPEEFHFTVKGRNYVMVEASEAAVKEFRSLQFRNAKINDGKVLADLGDSYASQSALVSKCVFDDKEPRGEKPVGIEAILKFPSRVTKDLFDRLKDMSDLNELDTVEVVDKQMEKLQERREKLLASSANGSANGHAEKNVQPIGTAASD